LDRSDVATTQLVQPAQNIGGGPRLAAEDTLCKESMTQGRANVAAKASIKDGRALESAVRSHSGATGLASHRLTDRPNHGIPFSRSWIPAVDTAVRLDCIGGFVVTQMYGLDRPTADVDVVELAPRNAAETIMNLGVRGGSLQQEVPCLPRSGWSSPCP